jgi:hypothetical protein
MQNSTTTTNSDSLTTSIPVCDSWGNILVGTSNTGQPTVLKDGSGVVNVSRTSAGVYGVSFSNPSQYGSGGYIMLFTPEITSTPAIIGSDRWMGGVGGATAPGRTAGFVFSTYAQQTPIGASGGTFAAADFTYNTLNVNFAAFNLGYDRDIHSHQVANLFIHSDKWNTNDTWRAANDHTIRVVGSADYPDILSPEGSISEIAEISSVSPYSGYIYYTPTQTIRDRLARTKNYAFSVYVQLIQGSTFSMTIGGVGNNFGCSFNLDTESVTQTGVASGKEASGLIQNRGNGWYRTTIVVRGGAEEYTPLMSLSNGGKALVWGPQFEEGSQSTRYTKTGSTIVIGDQDARKTLTPGSAGYGLTGSTYSSHMPNLLSKKTATAYGTIVVAPKKNNHVEYIDCYLENAFNVSGVSAMLDSPYSVQVNFLKHMKDSDYCVILGGEYEPIYADPDYSDIREYSILAVDRGSSNNLKTTSGFRVSAFKQKVVDNNFVRTSYSSTSAGVYEKIHFMVFGGSTYGSP